MTISCYVKQQRSFGLELSVLLTFLLRTQIVTRLANIHASPSITCRNIAKWEYKAIQLVACRFMPNMVRRPTHQVSPILLWVQTESAVSACTTSTVTFLKVLSHPRWYTEVRLVCSRGI